MSDKKPHKGWRFGPGPYELRLRHPVRLSSLEHVGKIIELTDLEMAVLALFVSHGGQKVSKQQMIDEVWGGVPVDDDTVAMIISRLKKKLPDPVIETIYNVGQRLTCPVDPLGTTAELHAAYLIALFTDADLERQTLPDEEWDRKYAPKIDEIRASLAWAMADPLRRHIAVDLFGATAQLFERLSLLPEARSNADRLLPLTNDGISNASAVRFFTYAGHLWRDADRLHALSLFQRAFGFYRKLKDSHDLATLLGKIGGTRLYLGKIDEAQADLEEAVNKLSKTDRKKDLFNALNDLGLLYSIKDKLADSKICFDRAIDIADSCKDFLRKYIAVLNLGEMEFNKGAPDRAILRCEEAARGLQSAPNLYRLMPLVNLATYHALQGDFAKAQPYAAVALSLSADGDGYWRRLALQACAFLAAQHGLHAYAAQLLGFIDQDFARSGEARQKPEQQLYDRLIENLRKNLSADSFQVWMSEGARWTEARAITFVEDHILVAMPTEKA